MIMLMLMLMLMLMMYAFVCFVFVRIRLYSFVFVRIRLYSFVCFSFCGLNFLPTSANVLSVSFAFRLVLPLHLINVLLDELEGHHQHRAEFWQSTILNVGYCRIVHGAPVSWLEVRENLRPAAKKQKRLPLCHGLSGIRVFVLWIVATARSGCPIQMCVSSTACNPPGCP